MDLIDSMSKNETVWTVGQLNRRVAQLLEGQFAPLWVRGEVSNFTRAASGHWYFTIKDDRAAVRAVMFRGRAQCVGFVPKAGECFEFHVSVTLYEPRGDYQVQVDMLRRAGRGDLHEAFLLLKEKLAAEGLFDAQRHRAISAMPRAIGVITSLAAAALRDVLSTLARRAPHVPIVIYPSPVQGMDAAGRIREALMLAVGRNEVDTLLLVRGGGSLEDLWSFNDESLARAIAASPIPVISGVGHETDFTIADFVADLRAPTPTAAAELACRARDSCLAEISSLFADLTARQLRQIEHGALRLDRAVAMLISPQQRLARQNERLRSLAHRLARVALGAGQRQSDQLRFLRSRLVRCAPAMDALRRQLGQCAGRLASGMQQQMAPRHARTTAALQTLSALNPRNVLGRGYAIVRDRRGTIIKKALDLNIGDQLNIELHKGRVEASVLSSS